MARGGTGAKVRPSLAGMVDPPLDGSPGQAGGRRGIRQAPLPPRYRPAGRESSPAVVRRPPTPLKTPRPLAVEGEDGPDGPAPRWVTWRGKRRPVASVEDDWRVDDEWWCDEVSRHYFAVTLADGCRLTLFLDRLAGTWWEQSY